MVKGVIFDFDGVILDTETMEYNIMKKSGTNIWRPSLKFRSKVLCGIDLLEYAQSLVT